MRSLIAALATTTALLLPPTPIKAQEILLGSINYFAFNFCPRGMLPADGRILNIPQYEALFSLLGTYYGGDGRSTFALPDLRNAVPVQTSNFGDQGNNTAKLATTEDSTVSTLAVTACIAADIGLFNYPQRS